MSTLIVKNLDAPTGESIVAPDLQLPSGSVVQVVNVVNDVHTTVTNTTSFDNTPVTATITPTSSSSKILVQLNPHMTIANNAGSKARGYFRIDRNSGEAFSDEQRLYLYDYGGSGLYFEHMCKLDWLDTPATTNTVTYTLQMKHVDGNGISCSYGDSTSTITLMEIAG